MEKNKPRTFPLRVNDQWLNSIDKVLQYRESKHEFVLDAVSREITRRKQGHDIIKEEK